MLASTLASILAATAALTLGFSGTAWSAASPTQPDSSTALHTVGNLQHGEALFVGCTACHATDGGGSGTGDVPAIAGQYRGVLVQQLVDFRHGARWDVRMERIAGSHRLTSLQDLADVAAFVAALPLRPTEDRGDGTTAQHGKAVFDERCAACHGPTATGSDAKNIPWLAAQSYQYLLREMYNTVDGRRPTLTGLHSRLFRKFEREDFVGVADYLSRLPH